MLFMHRFCVFVFVIVANICRVGDLVWFVVLDAYLRIYLHES